MNQYQTTVYNKFNQIGWVAHLRTITWDALVIAMGILLINNIIPQWIVVGAVAYTLANWFGLILLGILVAVGKVMLAATKVEISIDDKIAADKHLAPHKDKFFNNPLFRSAAVRFIPYRILDLACDLFFFVALVISNHPVLAVFHLIPIVLTQLGVTAIRKQTIQYFESLEDPLEGEVESIDDLADKLFHGENR